MGKIKHNSKKLNVFVVALLLPFLLLQIYTCYSFSTKDNHIDYVVVTKEVEEVDNTKEELIRDAQNKVNEEIKKYLEEPYEQRIKPEINERQIVEEDIPYYIHSSSRRAPDGVRC